jgi:hypothetical protein
MAKKFLFACLIALAIGAAAGFAMPEDGAAHAATIGASY